MSRAVSQPEIPMLKYNIESSADGLSKLFKEIKDKETIADLSIEYQKFAEWLRIELVLLVRTASCANTGSESLPPFITFS